MKPMKTFPKGILVHTKKNVPGKYSRPPKKVPEDRLEHENAVLEYLAALTMLASYGVQPLCTLFIAYLILFTRWWVPALAYVLWIQCIDQSSFDFSKRSRWVRGWALWRYAAKFYSATVVRTAALNPAQSYLFVMYPHGVLCVSMLLNFGSNGGGVEEQFPEHKVYVGGQRAVVTTPLCREVATRLGVACVDRQVLESLLSRPGGGNILAVQAGGVKEALLNSTSKYNLVLKGRKGFCRLALATGRPLVPVFNFGENRVTELLSEDPQSLLQRASSFMIKRLGLMVMFLKVFLPRRVAVTSLVGAPIAVKQVVNPTQEEVDELHGKFVAALVDLYNTHKHVYHKDEDIPLVIL